MKFLESPKFFKISSFIGSVTITFLVVTNMPLKFAVFVFVLQGLVSYLDCFNVHTKAYIQGYNDGCSETTNSLALTLAQQVEAEIKLVRDLFFYAETFSIYNLTSYTGTFYQRLIQAINEKTSLINKKLDLGGENGRDDRKT